ncbi:MAG TPA: succinate dehydrogenase, hydrophobic membrane anchor protein [Stellaceae bacterium]|nr:succinate dehydrogenase, hydrophobic membrane anchor protein [Stellaceae bacterium]
MSEPTDLRTPLGRAFGLGSAKEGVQHWWAQRLTAVAMVPLALWFCAGLIAHAGADRAGVFQWLSSPVQAILMVLLLGTGFHHMALGVQVVIEDYIHTEWAKIGALILNRFIAYGLAVAGIFAVMRIALGA